MTDSHSDPADIARCAVINYARLDYQDRQHHARYRRRVEETADSFPCQECGAGGGWVETVYDFGAGPWVECGWCEGTGRVTAWVRGEWLFWKRMAKWQKK